MKRIVWNNTEINVPDYTYKVVFRFLPTGKLYNRTTRADTETEAEKNIMQYLKNQVDLFGEFNLEDMKIEKVIELHRNKQENNFAYSI